MVIIKIVYGSSLVAEWVKDPALLLMWLEPLLWHGFNPWPRNFLMPRMWPPPPKKKEMDCIREGVWHFP